MLVFCFGLQYHAQGHWACCMQDFNSLYFMALFTINCRKVPNAGRNPDPEPPGKHTGKEKLPFNRKKPGAGPGLQAGTILLRVGQIKVEERGRRE